MIFGGKNLKFGRVDFYATNIQVAVFSDQWLARDIPDEHSRSAEPAIELKFGQSGRQMQPHADANRGVECARDNHRQPGFGGNRQRTSHTAKRCGLDHKKVGRTSLCNRQRVAHLAHRFIGRNFDRV